MTRRAFVTFSPLSYLKLIYVDTISMVYPKNHSNKLNTPSFPTYIVNFTRVKIS